MPRNPGEWLAAILIVVVLVYCTVIVASGERLQDHLSDLWRVYAQR